MSSAPPAIGIDWGSTHLRAFRFNADGDVVDTRRVASAVAARDFANRLSALVHDWLAGPDAVIMVCGMIGGRQGWIETPYIPCPCAIEAFAQTLTRAPAEFANVWIAPGAKSAGDNGRIDVLRGEETQIFGIIGAQADHALIIAPGTHSKWARAASGQLSSFRTYMTGEMFATLKAHSILGQPMPPQAPHHPEAFDLGVRRALEEKALLNLLFSVRTESLFARLPPEALESYLSGILIGAEISEASKRERLDEGRPVAVISSSILAEKYARALDLAGYQDVRLIDGERAAAQGLWRLATTRAAL